METALFAALAVALVVAAGAAVQVVLALRRSTPR
jgi:hypothetical protein